MSSKLQTQDRYAHSFQQLQASGRHALIPFTILGWPDPDTCLRSVDAFVAGGATALELGLAFSDPMADGPTIQKAAKAVLDAHFNVNDALQLLAQIRERHPAIPIGLLVYYNLVLGRGIDRFFADVAQAGADGVLIADLPAELAQEVWPAAQQHGVHLIGMVSPLTDEARLQQIAAVSGGFLYVVSRLGITGVEARHDQNLSGLFQRIRAHSALPACVGFGISQPEHVQKMLGMGAQGVVVGSALIERIQQLPPGAGLESVAQYLQSLADPVIQPLA
jgi:tryptophan synthase alpha chain